jgi:NAD(P)-dependent dehydrogenase (short-subunit alcohol dehydrogenase family)
MVVFSNAGVVSRGSFYDEQEENATTSSGLPIPSCPEDAIRTSSVNLNGAIFTAYLALHYMRKSGGGGSLLFTASSAALIPPSAVPVYGGSKAGVVQFSRCIASPYMKRGVRVNCLCPGFSHTNIAGPGFFEVFPQEHLMPVELYVKHVRDLITDDTANGKVIEISGKEHFLHHVPEPSNDSMRAILKVVDSDTF